MSTRLKTHSKVKGYTHKKLLVCLFNLTFILPYLLLCLIYVICDWVRERLDDLGYYYMTPLRRNMYNWAWYKKDSYSEET